MPVGKLDQSRDSISPYPLPLLIKPKDDQKIEQMFVELMHKRGWHNLPEAARRQMLAYAPAKKWALLHQEMVNERHLEQKRRQQSTNSPDEEDSPEWYVKKVVRGAITLKELRSLSVNLRVQPISWVRAFIRAQGQVALANVLAMINRQKRVGPARVPADEEILDKENDIVKCLKALMNTQFGADDALAHQSVLIALTNCLTSPRLPTRKLASEVLTFLCYYKEKSGYAKVLQALDHVRLIAGENGRFEAWMRLHEVAIDSRGGTSDGAERRGNNMGNLLMEYGLATLILVNTIIDGPEHDLNLRCSIRAEFYSCGIERILMKMETFDYELINRQITRFRENEVIDHEDMQQLENESRVDGVSPRVKDLTKSKEYAEAMEVNKQEPGGRREAIVINKDKRLQDGFDESLPPIAAHQFSHGEQQRQGGSTRAQNEKQPPQSFYQNAQPLHTSRFGTTDASTENMNSSSFSNRTYGPTTVSDNATAVLGDVYNTHHYYGSQETATPIDAPFDQQQAFVASVMSAAAKFGIQTPSVPTHKDKDEVSRWVREVIEANMCATTIWDGQSAVIPASVGTSLGYVDQAELEEDLG